MEKQNSIIGFMNEHPFYTLLILSTLVEGTVEIIKTFKGSSK
jgi:hypothetical protein